MQPRPTPSVEPPPPPPAPTPSRGDPARPLDRAFEGVTADDWAAIRARAPALEADWGALEAAVREQEAGVLRALCSRTLALEVNVARLRGELAGATPQARFASYLARLRDEPGAWGRLFGEYAVLGEAFARARANYRDQVVEALGRLAADGRALAEALRGGRPLGRLRRLDSSLSDPHGGGRVVWRLSFAESDGGEWHVMYKPKAVAPDARFQRLLAACNEAAARGELALGGAARERLGLAGFPRFYVLGVLDRGGYGWVEHVAAGPCESAAGVERFYVRQGAYLALLHVLRGVDLHYENVVAHGEHPVLVDLETLFHPEVRRAEARSASARAEALLRRSVGRIGLLPWRTFGRDGGVNFGALGDGGEQMLPYAVRGWEGEGRDDMRSVERSMALPAAANLPTLGGRVAPFAEHLPAFIAGFEAVARYVRAEVAGWLAPGGRLDSFADATVRYVLRPTAVYARVLAAATHPDRLREAAAREALLDLLAPSGESAAWLGPVLEAEKEALRDHDVPTFYGRPNSADLYDGRGRRHVRYFAAPCLDEAKAQLAAFDESEVARQVWVLRATTSAALGAPAPRDVSLGGERPLGAAVAPGAAAAARALAAATEIGARLADLAIEGDDGVTWLGAVGRGAETFALAPLGPDLYDGAAGVALFLGHLGRAGGEARFGALALRAAEALLAGGAPAPGASVHAGGFFGAPSRLYALAHLGALFDDGVLHRALDGALAGLEAAVEASDHDDVIYGASGCILALLAAYAVAPRERLVDVARACLRRLERRAVDVDGGAAWRGPLSDRPLLGFSHGAAGVACALERLGALLAAAGSPDAERCRALAAAALRYERAHFRAARGNWPDYRAPREAGERFQLAWCHGAPGIALARLAGAASPDPASVAEIDAAVTTTLAAAPRERHTLCHGEVGNLAIVARAAAALGRADWQAGVEARLSSLLAALGRRGPLVDFAFAESDPALMNGLAGVGYGLLALARPAQTPSVLALEPPRARDGARSPR